MYGKTITLVLLAAAPAAAQSSRVVALPDTQNYSRSYPQIFNSQTQWVVDRFVPDGIAFVSSIGKGVDGDFLTSLAAIGNGESYYPKEVREMAGFEKAQILSDLSERETEVLEALCQGMSNKEISEVMFVSAETVKSHVSTVISKLGVKDRTQAVITAIRSGM